MSESKGVTILGSTGTIGLNTLDVITRNPESFHIVGLSANSNVEGLYEQCRQYQPQFAVLKDQVCAKQLAAKIESVGLNTQVLTGLEGLQAIAQHENTDYVMAAIVGAAGLLPTLAAAEAGKRILLANKEALVMAGPVFMDAVIKNNAELLPIDSEHNAVFQCLPKPGTGCDLSAQGVDSILLTASGGPFRTVDLKVLDDVTPEMACAHPNWDMGDKISVDSATMMNKGLEVIEAHWLFGLSEQQITVVMHPESIIHSMVSYCDGSILAQLGNPDMRTPIAYGLAWPHRMASGVEPLDIFKVADLSFEKPDFERFPCLKLALDALQNGGTATAILNAANEVAVDGFLKKRIKFTDIPRIIESTLTSLDTQPATSLEVILGSDEQARQVAQQSIKQVTHSS